MKSCLFILSVLLSLITTACNQNTDANGDYYLFVGTYTGEGSDGIYLFGFDSKKGTLAPVDTVKGIENPSYLALSPDQSNLYAVNEMPDSSEASVAAFSFDKASGEIRFLNKQSSRGGAPCYVDTDRNGQSVFVGNYLGGSLAEIPVQSDGSLSEANLVIEHEGSSLNPGRQESPHVHCTLISPDNNLLFVADLGTDLVTGYPYDGESGGLDPDPAFLYSAEPGAGPRHLTFHPNGEYLYLVNELDVLTIVEEDLERVQTVSTLPEYYEGAVSGADIHVSPDGRFLYVSNREDLNNIVIYSVDDINGTLNRIGEISSGGIHPRNFTIDPTGRYLLVANRHTDSIVIFRRDKETGMLEPAGEEVHVSQPVSLVFADKE